MMNEGMDIARINMDFHSINDMQKITENVNLASRKVGCPCPIMVDLKGLLLRTVSQTVTMEVQTKDIVRVGFNPELSDDDGIFIIDYSQSQDSSKPLDKLPFRVGDMVLVDY
jgi:pyruvate kinase